MSALFESRFCQFEPPQGWLVLPRAGVLENRPTGVQRSALVMENWLDTPATSADYAGAQVAFLRQEAPDVEVVAQQPFPGRGFADAFVTVLRRKAADGTPLRQELVTAIEGPLAVSLTLTGLESDSAAWSRLFGGIVGSFSIPAARWTRSIARGGILSPAEKAAERTAKAPGLQVALPIPAGWAFDEKSASLRSPSGAELAGRRGGLPSAAPDELFADALEKLHRDPAWRARRWDRGTLPEARSFFALEAVAARESGSSWSKKGPQVVREVYAQDDGVIVFRLVAGDGDAEALAALSAVVYGYTMLPEPERSLSIQEPWWKVELPGPWIAGGGGVYVLPPAPARLVAAQKLPASLPLPKFVEHAVPNLRNQPDFVSSVSDQTRELSIRGLATFQFALDYEAREAGRTSVRACWAEGPGSLYNLVVKGPAGSETEALFGRVTGGLDVEAVRQGR